MGINGHNVITDVTTNRHNVIANNHDVPDVHVLDTERIDDPNKQGRCV